MHGSSNFRSCKQRIRVRFLKAMDLGVQRLEDFKEKFPPTFTRASRVSVSAVFATASFTSAAAKERAERPWNFHLSRCCSSDFPFCCCCCCYCSSSSSFRRGRHNTGRPLEFREATSRRKKYVWRQFLHAFLSLFGSSKSLDT